MNQLSLETHVQSALAARVKPGACLVVGLSGGLDSVVLLHLLDRLCPRLDFQLSAIHVNHQISPHAADWVEFCRILCAARQIPLTVETVAVARDSGLGLEAAARTARHEVFARCGADFVVLAHHQDDQAETLLLRLLRGTGVQGAGAIREVSPIWITHPHQIQDQSPGPTVLRPLLEVQRAQLLAYAQHQGLAWIEDESNLSVKYRRNFIRHHVAPLLEQAFPAYRDNLSRAAKHFAEAASLLTELAQHDALTALYDGKLAATRLAELSPARAANLLRYYFASEGLPMPDEDRLREMLRQLTQASPDADICMVHAGREIHRFQGQVQVVDARFAPDPTLCLEWRGEHPWRIEALAGTVRFAAQPGAGIDAGKLAAAPVTLRLRRGGEHFRPSCHRPRRSLKNLLQEAHIPPWRRDCLPLLFCGEQLVWVPGIGIECCFQCVPGSPGWGLTWDADVEPGFLDHAEP